MNNKLVIRQANAEDVTKIAEIEDKCFLPAEAASLKSFLERFMSFPECFFVAELDGKVVGHINGCVTDEPSPYPRIFPRHHFVSPDSLSHRVYPMNSMRRMG